MYKRFDSHAIIAIPLELGVCIPKLITTSRPFLLRHSLCGNKLFDRSVLCFRCFTARLLHGVNPPQFTHAVKP